MTAAVLLSCLTLWTSGSPIPTSGPDTIPGAGIRELLETIPVRPLQFAPPRPTEVDVDGVPLFHLRDPSLPLVKLFARFETGYGHLDREWFGAATVLPLLLRAGGAAELPPDSVEIVLEGLAAETTFGGSGTSLTTSLDVPRDRLPEAVGVWSEMLVRPAFEPAAVENRREVEMEVLRRTPEDLGRLAVIRFNRLMFGDHFIGWELSPEDLMPERVNQDRLRRLSRMVLCRDRLVLGASGDLTLEEAEEALRPLVARLPPCPSLGPRPPPVLRPGPQIVLVPQPGEQSIIVMGKGSSVRRDTTRAYFAAQVGNSLLGGGFSSRLVERVRTREGLAYGASSFWTIPPGGAGVIGAMTRTRGERTVEALSVLEDVLDESRGAAPTATEIATVVDQVVHGFVFAFETPDVMVSRRMSLRSQGLPPDWPERYVAGIAAVEARDVASVTANELRPDRMVVLVVGDPEVFDVEALAARGPVQVWRQGEEAPPPVTPSGPRGSPRSPR